MSKLVFKLTHKDDKLRALIAQTDQKTLARWATECAKRLLPYFENQFPDDSRPKKAIETLSDWLKSGVFKMSVVRKASLDAHAAAREVGADSPARSAARAAGQAVATAHVKTHAYGPAIYGQQAIFRDTGSIDAANKERDWQYQRLLELLKKS